jgi:hypothetical protein
MPMLRPTLLALLLIAGQQARAAGPTVITLSCNGTSTDKSSTSLPTEEPKPIQKMGVVANLHERTVSFMGFIAPIVLVDASVISFNGEQLGAAAQIAGKDGLTQRIDGILDRVTGHMVADVWTYKKGADDSASLVSDANQYDVLCKATNRVF